MFELIGKTDVSEIDIGPDHYTIVSRSSCWPNQIYEVSTKAKDSTALIEKAKTKSLPIKVSSWITPVETIEALRLSTVKQGEWAAMTLNLETWEKPADVPGLTIREIGEEPEIEEWSSIVETELMMGRKLNSVIFHQLKLELGIRFFGGYIADEMVSTCVSLEHEHEVGVYLIGTKARSRKQGFGMAITTHALQEAKERGCSISHLQATKLGESVYQKLGYLREGKIEVFVF